MRTFKFLWYSVSALVLLESCYLGWQIGNWAWAKTVDSGLITRTVYAPYSVEVKEGDTLDSIVCRVAAATDSEDLAKLTWQIQQATKTAFLQPGQVIYLTIPQKEVLHRD